MAMYSKVDKREEHMIMISDYGKRKLLTYADSFRELASSFAGDFHVSCEDRQTLLEAKKLWENRQILKENLNEMAQIMTNVATEIFQFRGFEEKAKKQIMHYLKMEKIIVEDIFYITHSSDKEAIGVTMYTEHSHGYSSEEIANMLSVLLNKRLVVSVTSPYMVDKEKGNYIFVEEPKYIVLSGFAKVTKENEVVTGDNYSIVESEKGKITVILSDGMGSGEKANEDSEKVLDLMEKMLEAGYHLDKSIHMVNNALIAAGEKENMSTLDICSLDLYDGICEFRKIGAATSFLKSSDRVEQIVSSSLPLGIFQSVESEVFQKQLYDGDYIIMMSDGVLDALNQNEYEEAMCKVISRMKDINPGEIAEQILQYALHCSGGRVQDDMTILVLGIWENT